MTLQCRMPSRSTTVRRCACRSTCHSASLLRAGPDHSVQPPHSGLRLASPIPACTPARRRLGPPHVHRRQVAPLDLIANTQHDAHSTLSRPTRHLRPRVHRSQRARGAPVHIRHVELPLARRRRAQRSRSATWNAREITRRALYCVDRAANVRLRQVERTNQPRGHALICYSTALNAHPPLRGRYVDGCAGVVATWGGAPRSRRDCAEIAQRSRKDCAKIAQRLRRDRDCAEVAARSSTVAHTSPRRAGTWTLLVLASLHSIAALRALLGMMVMIAISFGVWYSTLAACGLRSQFGLRARA